MEQPIKNRWWGGVIFQKKAPIFDRPVRGQEGAFSWWIALDNDIQQTGNRNILMVCKYGMDDVLGLTMFLCKVSTYRGVWPLNLMVYRFPDIMKKPCPLRFFHIDA